MAQVTASLDIHGLKELDAALRALPEEVAGPILLDALTAAGAVVQRAAQDNIRSRTGATAADIRVEVQTQPAQAAGVAAVGGTRKGTGARAHVLRWLEFGAKPHKIVAGATDRKDARRAARALRRIGDARAASALRRGIRSGDIKVRRALKLPGGVFRSAVNHPGVKGQSPLTRALAEQGERAIQTFKDAAWAGIVAAAKRLNVRAA